MRPRILRKLAAALAALPALAPAPAVAGLTPIPIACGAMRVPGSTSGPSERDTHSGTLLDFSGPEAVYSFRPPAASWVVVTLEGPPELWLLDYGPWEPAAYPTGCVDLDTASVAYAGAQPSQDYYFVVDGVAAAAGSFFVSVECFPSANVIALPCGGTGTLSLAPPSLFNRYRCEPAAQRRPGAEGAVGFTPTAAGHVQVTVDAPFPVQVLLSRGADSPLAPSDAVKVRCAASGQGGAAVWDAAAEEYYAFVEAPAGASGTATVSVHCGTQLTCATPDADLACNGRVAGDTRGRPNRTSLYSCDGLSPDGVEVGAQLQQGGGEHVMTFRNPVAQNVRFELNGSPGQTAYLLEGCDEGHCLVSSERDRVFFTASWLAAGDYTLVVDGPAGGEGPFEVTARCQGVGGNLRPAAADASGLTVGCEDGAVSGDLLVSVTNLASQAVASGFEVTVFEDLDGDRALTGADNPLGSARRSVAMAAHSTIVLAVPVSGLLRFGGSPLHVLVSASVDGEEHDPWDDVLAVSPGACRSRPRAVASHPFVKWSAATVQYGCNPASTEVFSYIATGHLNDDDGDGRIGPGDVADVVANTVAFGDSNDLRAYDGIDGSLLFEVCQDSSHNYLRPLVAVLAAGSPPVVLAVERERTPPNTTRLVALSNAGDLLWRGEDLAVDGIAGFSLADLDHDGTAEIVWAKVVLNADGTVRWVGSERFGGGRRVLEQQTSSVADLDGDGSPEVVVGPSAYHADGSVYWSRTDLPDGFTAVADFDGDGVPEVVLAANYAAAFDLATMYLLEHDGTTRWGPVGLEAVYPLANPPFYAGPPAVADFDGDGRPDIAVASNESLHLLDADGRLVWSLPYKATKNGDDEGPSGFDFDGDGVPELVHVGQDLDYHGLRLLNGRDGSQRLVVHPSHASSKYNYIPPVLDLDADGHADVLVPRAPLTSRTVPANAALDRLTMWSDYSWPAARGVWNQVSYHVTNVNDDGTVPAFPVDSWKAGNTYRVQTSPGTFADVSASRVRLGRAGCPGAVELSAVVGNGGNRATAGPVPVAFYAGAALVGVTATSRALAPGEWEEVSVLWPSPPGSPVTILARADDDGTGTGLLAECDEANNACTLAGVTACSGCVAAAAVEPVAPVCEGEPVTIQASASVIVGCAGSVEYRFLDGPKVLRDWGTDPRHAFTPAASLTVVVEARCAAETICRDAAETRVTVEPDVLPETVGNTLLAVRSLDDVFLEWGPSAGSLGYRVRGATLKDFSGSTPALDLGGPAGTLAGVVPPPPALVFYRALGLGCSGREGP